MNPTNGGENTHTPPLIPEDRRGANHICLESGPVHTERALLINAKAGK